jgi:tetratricopeptide (TPR) repeat protein
MFMFVVCFSATVAVAQTDYTAVGEAINNGLVLKSEKRYDDAVGEFMRAVDLASSAGDEKSKKTGNIATQQIINCHIQNSYSLYEQQHFDEAIAALQKAKEAAELADNAENRRVIDAAMPRMIFAKGINLMEKNYFEEALVVFDQSLTLNPNQTNVLLAVGVLYQKIGNFEKALEYYEQTINATSKNTADAVEARKAAVNYLLSAGQQAKNE